MEAEQTQMKNKFKNLKSNLLEVGEKNKEISKWLDATSINGIVHVFKSKSLIRRLIWALIFLLAAAYCIYNIADRGSYFDSRPSATTVSVTTNQSLAFPAVTICNFNPVDRVIAEPLGLTDLLQFYYDPYTYIITRSSDFVEFDEFCQGLVNRSSAASMLLRDLYTVGAITIEESNLLCNFDVSFCHDKDFTPVMTNLGLCYSINANETKFYAQSTGARSGLRMLYDIRQSNRYIASFDGTAGVKVAIHSEDTLPEPDELGIAIQPGKSAYISVTAHKIDDQTGNGCGNPSKALTYFPNYNYSVSLCHANIIADNIVKNCSCLSPVSTLTGSNIRDCTVADLCCIWQTLYLSRTDFSSCIPSCQRTVYSTSVSYGQFPDDMATRFLQQGLNVTQELITSDLLKIHIYYEELSVTNVVTSFSYTFTALLSDIGGQLGLFLGASVITMLEIGLLLFDILKSIVKPLCCAKTKKQGIETELTEVKVATESGDDGVKIS